MYESDTTATTVHSTEVCVEIYWNFLRLYTMLVAGVDNGGSVLVRTTFMRFYFR